MGGRTGGQQAHQRLIGRRVAVRTAVNAASGSSRGPVGCRGTVVFSAATSVSAAAVSGRHAIEAVEAVANVIKNLSCLRKKILFSVRPQQSAQKAGQRRAEAPERERRDVLFDDGENFGSNLIRRRLQKRKEVHREKWQIFTHGRLRQFSACDAQSLDSLAVDAHLRRRLHASREDGKEVELVGDIVNLFCRVQNLL